MLLSQPEEKRGKAAEIVNSIVSGLAPNSGAIRSGRTMSDTRAGRVPHVQRLVSILVASAVCPTQLHQVGIVHDRGACPTHRFQYRMKETLFISNGPALAKSQP